MKNRIIKQIEESIALQKEVFMMVDYIIEVAEVCVNSLKEGGKLLFCGNGGSAADAQHLAAEFIVRLSKDKPSRGSIPAIALTTNTSVLTAAANDFGFHQIFSRQVEGLGKRGDVLFGISTSGNSKNVIEAINKAKEMGVITVGLTGNNGGKIKELCDYLLTLPNTNPARVQESHILIEHILCDVIEEIL